MLPSVVPRLATDSAVRVFPGVWKLLSFLRLPSQEGAPSLPLLPLFFSFIFFLPPFEDNGLLFWLSDVFCQHSKVVLWNLLSVQMFFWRICWGESGIPVLFFRHLRTTFPLQYSCLRNPMDRGAWQATVRGVAQSQTRLKQLSTYSEWWGGGIHRTIQGKLFQAGRTTGMKTLTQEWMVLASIIMIKRAVSECNPVGISTDPATCSVTLGKSFHFSVLKFSYL